MKLSTLPVEVGELIFSAVVWDDFTPECVESLNEASKCINRVHERNRQLRSLRLTAKFVDCIVNRLAFKYVHITSQRRAAELINAVEDRRIPGAVVRHLFLGDKLGRYHPDNAPNYSWVTAESGKDWIEYGTFYKLLAVMPHLLSLHIHLPGIHSQIFTSVVRHGRIAPLSSLESIRCLSLYDDVNNSACYKPVRTVPGARDSLSVFPNLQYLVVSESEGLTQLDKLTASSSSQQTPQWYAPRLQRIQLEKWCPMESDFILYNLAMEIPLTELRMLRKVPRRMSMDGNDSSYFNFADSVDVHKIIERIGPTLTSLRLDFAYHFADDLISTNVHLCAAIRDNCQNLEYLTLSFPPPDNLDDAPKASVCHQLFRAPVSFTTRGAGMLNLKKAEIIGHHSYCEGSSRKMVIDASEDVWATQTQMVWEASTENGTSDDECLHTNIQIHGTPANEASLLNCRELRGFSGTLPDLSSRESHPRKRRRCVEDMHEKKRGPTLTLEPPLWLSVRGLMWDALPSRLNKRKHVELED